MSKSPLLLLALLLALVGCKERPQPEQIYDASRARRVFQPPPGEVRPVPPHAIHAAGVGPYALGAPLKDILELLPRGPRVVLMEIDGLLDYSVVRAETDTMVIGVQRPEGVRFVAVLEGETARTESGVGVGASRDELVAAMGPLREVTDEARDPRILVFESLPNAQFVMRGDRVVAALVARVGAGPMFGPPGGDPRDGGAEPARPAPAASPPHPCRDGAALLERRAELVEAAGFEGGEPQVAIGCFGGAAAVEALVWSGDEVAVVAGEPSRPRRVAAQRTPGLVFAAAIDAVEDGRDEIVLVTERRSDDELVIAIEVARLEGGRLVRLIDQELYRLTTTSAAWIGAKLAEVELLVELSSSGDALAVSGLFVQADRRRVRNAAPLSTRNIQLRRRRPPPGGSEGEASGEARDAAAGVEGVPPYDAGAGPVRGEAPGP